jgi:protein Mpv17
MWWPCDLQAGWKLWPFAHLITYGLVPVEQRLLWVDCVEILWVTILSMFANEKSEKRLEAEGGKEAVLMLSSDELETSKASEDLQ